MWQRPFRKPSCWRGEWRKLFCPPDRWSGQGRCDTWSVWQGERLGLFPTSRILRLQQARSEWLARTHPNLPTVNITYKKEGQRRRPTARRERRWGKRAVRESKSRNEKNKMDLTLLNYRGKNPFKGVVFKDNGTRIDRVGQFVDQTPFSFSTLYLQPNTFSVPIITCKYNSISY